VVPPVVRLLSSRTEATLQPTGRNTPLYTLTHPDGHPTPSTLAFSSLTLPFHFATQTQHHGAVEEGRLRRRLGPSSRGYRLHDHCHGGRDFGSTAGRPSRFAPLQQGDEEGVIEPCHR
jgi:hypothetical protein